MTKQEYWDKMENVLLGCPDLWWNRWNVTTKEYLETLYEEIATLKHELERIQSMGLDEFALCQHNIKYRSEK